MVGNLIIRGIIVGIVAGLLAFGWAKTFGEPAVSVAIDFESSHEGHEHATGADDHDHGPATDDHGTAAAAGHSHGDEAPEMFSRDVQSGIGLLTGVVAIGAALGGVFGVLFAFAYGRLGNLGPAPTSVVLALLGLVAVYVVPALKYPANPPAVGEPDTIQLRTGLYFLMVAISVAAAIGGSILRGRMARQFGAWNGSVITALGYVAVLMVAFMALPVINEVPADFPAHTLWDFRIASLGIQAVLWMSIGVLFGYIGAPVVKAQRS